MNSVRRATKAGLLLTGHSAGYAESSLDQDQAKSKRRSQTGDLNLVFDHRDDDRHGRRATIQNTSSGTTSHCNSGLRPVPMPGSLGMMSR